jgi:bacterioferritin (cytochrome b1)
MKGDAKVIEYLNKELRHELTAVNFRASELNVEPLHA